MHRKKWNPFRQGRKKCKSIDPRGRMCIFQRHSKDHWDHGKEFIYIYILCWVLEPLKVHCILRLSLVCCVTLQKYLTYLSCSWFTWKIRLIVFTLKERFDESTNQAYNTVPLIQKSLQIMHTYLGKRYLWKDRLRQDFREHWMQS